MNKLDSPAEKGLSPVMDQRQLVASRQVVAGMLVAFNNFSLYPVSHSICLQSLKTFTSRLHTYLETYGNLRLEVGEWSISMGDQEVHKDSNDKEQLAALLYRDGIKWFEFQPGTNLDEISQLLSVLKKNRVQQEEISGDIVTALWEANLPHLDYEAVDFISDAEEIENPIDLKSVPDGDIQHVESRPLAGKGEGEGYGVADYEKISVNLRQRYDLELNSVDRETLKRLVQDEEEKNVGQEALEILLVILNEQEVQGDFSAILSFIKEEFVFDLGIGEFQDMCDFLTRLRKYQVSYRQDRLWASRLLGGFFKEISTAETVDVLAEVLAGYDDPKLKASLTSMARLLQLLSPAVIPGLALLLTKGYSELVELPVLTAIKTLAERDLSPLAAFLPGAEAALVMKLIPLLSSLKNGGSDELLYNLLDYKDKKVQVRILEKLLSQGKKLKKRHFALVDDPDLEISQLALKLLGSERSEFAEAFLLDYLESKHSSIEDDNHLLTCYRALGGCGSGRSLPYLVKVLTEGAWKDVLGMDKKVARHAAARALFLLDIPAATKVLHDGAASKYDCVQEACEMVLGKKR